jgi:hypothetical protein
VHNGRALKSTQRNVKWRHGWKDAWARLGRQTGQFLKHLTRSAFDGILQS